MAVRSLHDRDFCPDAVEPHDAIDPPALDLQLESELDEELSRGREVVNDDAHVVHYKRKVIAEAFRVLKPGGRFAVSDVVFLGDKRRLPSSVLRMVGLWTGCIAGALEKGEYGEILREAGFEDVSVEVTNVYEPEAVEGLGGPEEVEALRKVPAASAFVRAWKPAQ